MTATAFIAKKKRGEAHTPEEMERFIQEFLDGHIADYQVAAWLMAVCLQGMEPEETWHFTRVLAASGRRFAPDEGSRLLDKHSTGGVGDTTTLIVVPIVTSLGLPMVKLSGRGLGHTGGTIDKLAAIPGLKTQLTMDEIHRVLTATGMVIGGQSEDLATADGLLYQLRDVTATVDSIPLIAASIMSKKLALGAKALVLDVKTGRGALMPTRKQARELADTMLHIASRSGLSSCALITDMNQPLSVKVGNALEVEAALEVLAGASCGRLYRLSLHLAARLLELGNVVSSWEEGYAKAQRQLDSGAALEQFTHWVVEQGGKPNWQPGQFRLPRAPETAVVHASSSGFVRSVDARFVGEATARLGAGRQRKEDVVDPGAGLILKVEIGSEVEAGTPLALMFSSSQQRLDAAYDLLEQAFIIEEERVTPPRLVLEQRP